MFIRLKKIKKNNYAYLVNNKWTKKGTRQKVSKYFGRVYELNQLQNITYLEYIKYNEDYINNSSAKEIIISLVSWVIESYGFIKDPKKKLIWKLNNSEGTSLDKSLEFIIDLNKLKVMVGNKDAVLKINNDFLCNFTLKRLVKFRSNNEKTQVGVELAKAFISAGIPIPEEIFIHIFHLIYKEGQSYVS